MADDQKTPSLLPPRFAAWFGARGWSVRPHQAGLIEASGRSLASPLLAPRDVPAFDNAAVDGYAFGFGAGMREGGARLTLATGRAAHEA